MSHTCWDVALGMNIPTRNSLQAAKTSSCPAATARNASKMTSAKMTSAQMEHIPSFDVAGAAAVEIVAADTVVDVVGTSENAEVGEWRARTRVRRDDRESTWAVQTVTKKMTTKTRWVRHPPLAERSVHWR